ncbi:MAG: hypothetical protein PQJ59_16625 [Spirochaetales bacterium]|nr:hypothetical protein [Spirochaetales bacterium]
MTLEQYEKRYAELKEQGIRSMHFGFNGQLPVDFLKIEVFEEVIKESHIHMIERSVNENGQWVKKKEIVDWKKGFIFMLGGLCGIESDPFVSEKTGKYAYLSHARLWRLLPSMNKESVSAEYEFDAEIRAEETILKNEIKFQDYQQKVAEGKKPRYEVYQKYKTEADKRLAVVEMAKFGRQRADSGAHKRGIIKMLKLPNPREEFIGMTVFCFKCVPNLDNMEMRHKLLNDDKSAQEVFGIADNTGTIPHVPEGE